MNLLDHNWRVENLYKIVDKSGNMIPFKRNNIQQIIANDTALRKMILKARQFGVSTERLITKFDLTIFNRNKTTAIIAHEQDAVEKLFRIVARAHKNMPEELKPALDRGGGSRHEMYFPEINSRIYCDLEIRGDTVQILHVSEAAFMKDSSKLKATLQAVPMDGIVDIESTANGLNNHYYEMWNDSDQPYKKLFFPWYIFPQYRMLASKNLELTEDEIKLKKKAKQLFNINIDNEQLSFRRYKKAELKVSAYDKKIVTFEQEYPEDDVTCFLTSGDAVFNLFLIKEMIDKCQAPISDNGWLSIYSTFDKTKRYVIGADTSEGVGGDFSVGVMIEVQTRKVIAVMHGQWKPYDFAHKLKDLCSMFSMPSGPKPLLAVERNNHGHAVLLELKENINYENLYVHTDEKTGWRTDNVTRPIMINAFINALENKFITIHDKYILNECLVLINNNGKIEAVGGKHDDSIIATSIALQMCLNSSNLDIYENIRNKILL